MKRITSRAAAPFVFALVLASLCSAAELPPLAEGWKNTAYPGLVGQLRPRNQNNMKFIFLGEPIPCTVSGGMSGYGGFVQMKKHSLLWMHTSRMYFYIVNADGALCSLTPVDSLEEASVYPRMVDVRITRRRVWVEPETKDSYDPDMNGGAGGWYEETVRPGYYKTVTERSVHPLLSQYEKERLAAFGRANFKSLPLCQ